MILCITPNPAVDHTLVVPKLIPGEVHRTTQTIAAAGGKGLNAARVIKALGGDPLCMGFLGGHGGRLVADLAEREGLRGAWMHIENETRTCVIVVQNNGGEATVINEPGPRVSDAEWAALSEQVKRESAAARWVSFSGSLPPDSKTESFANLVRDLIAMGKEVWVDTSGAALEAVLDVRGVNLKINGDEGGLAVNGEAAQTVDQAVAVARRLRRRGVGQAVITLGRLGAVSASGSELFQAQPPTIKAVSAVGSGDAFLGALVWALAQNQSAVQALRCGVAAGAANALSVSGGHINLSDFEHLLPNVSHFSLE